MSMQRKSVLLVDDSDAIFHLLTIILGRLDYTVHNSSDGTDALVKARMRLPDMVISESSLPDGSGMDLFRALRADRTTATIPFIILTTEHSPSARSEALAAGVQAYLTKPINVRSLYHAIEDHMEHRRRHYIRLPLSLLVKIREGGDMSAYQTQSFGEGGMFIKSFRPFPLGTKLDTLVHLPEREPPLSLRGEVIHSVVPPVRHGHPGMGMKFIDVPHQMRGLLSAFMEAVLTDPSGMPRPALAATSF
jgi:DNA-binding response OmpR family regulator